MLRYMRLFCGYGVEKLILLAAAAPSWTQREGYPYGLTRKYVDSLICSWLRRTDRSLPVTSAMNSSSLRLTENR